MKARPPGSRGGGPSGGGTAGGSKAAVFARVDGRVQGVGFRYTCLCEGRRLGLSGWVRNNPDGSVEVWAEGPEARLDALIEWLRHGPPYARVDSLDYERRAPLGAYRGFTVEG
ncbi:MAG: acylphosphatase [Treponema sp.]|jgi:acylphosphatase|nr:acylphosphatase [Treponema sp.]